MLKQVILAFAFAALFQGAFSQEGETKSPKTSNHYVGVQINQLIRQVFNFSGASSAINNPYLLTYAVNSVQTRWGANFGLGYTFNEFTDGDAFTRRTTKINDFYFRVGFEKKSAFGKHWMLSAGGDIVIDLESNATTTHGSDPSTTFTTKNSNNGFGLGPRVTLSYEVSDRMFVGTEATYYFKFFTNRIENRGNFSEPNTEEKLKRFQFGAPAVIFLMLKF